MSNSQFTLRAQTALRLAQKASVQLGHGYVGSEHMLLGLLNEGQGTASLVLRQSGLDQQTIQSALTQLVGIGAPGGLPSQGLTPRCKKIIELAIEETHRLGQHYVGTEHLLMGLLREGEGVAARILTGNGLDLKKLYRSVTASLGGNGASNPSRSGRPRTEYSADTRLLDQFSRDLTKLADRGALDPVIGRETEVRRVIQILSRRTKNNPALIGEPGVGKTAVAEALAQHIAAGDVPDDLRRKRLLALDLSSMVAGTKYRGEFEERVKNILSEVRRAGDIILFLDEMHTIVGAGSAEGAIDAANILKPALGRGELQVVGATTLDEYRRYIEKDAALERRFQPVTVAEPDAATALAILNGLRSRYEAHHKLSITDEAIQASVELSRRYLHERRLPDKAIDLIDEAASRVRICRRSAPPDLRSLEAKAMQARQELEAAVRSQDFEKAALLRDAEKDFRRELEAQQEQWRASQPGAAVTADDVSAVVSDWTGIPVTALSEPESHRLLELEEELHRHIIGQDDAVSAVARAIRRGRAGLKEERRPIGSFLFLGPTGVGKTELCKALAHTLFGSADALLRFDMTEYREAHSVSRLLGSPPGYVGHENGGQLTEQVRRRPYCVVLFDELEKAHPDVWSTLLQITEDGVLTDAMGRKVDFSNTVVVLTSNAGAHRITAKGGKLGFSSGGNGAGRSPKELKALVLDEVRQVFRPEFLNRLDEIIVFQQLEQAQIKQIARHMLDDTARRLAGLGAALNITDSAVEALAAAGFDPVYGARPLRRAIRTRVEDPLAELLLKGTLSKGGRAFIDAAGAEITISTAGSSFP